MKKRIPENLFQFKEYQFFHLFEELKEEGEQETKELVQNQEETGNAVVEKAKENFTRFEKDAKGYVARYKEFWNENEAVRTQFGEGAKVYKMFDSNYVVALMTLPDEALEPEKIDNELEAVPDEENKEDLKEAFEPDEEEKDIESSEKPEETSEPFTPEDPATQGPTAGGPDPLKPQPEFEEHPEEEVLDTPGEPKMCLIVYEVSNEQRDEVFRTSVNSVMHAFEEFYENTFKGAMKAIIAKAKEKLEGVKKEAEVKAKEEEMTAKKAKVDKFLKESFIGSFKQWYNENAAILKQEYIEEVGDEPRELRPSFKEWCKERYEWLKEYEG